LQPIKVESRKPGSRQKTLQSDDWRVLGYAPGVLAPRGQRSRSNVGKRQRWANLRLVALSLVALVLAGSLIVSQNSSSTSSSISVSLWDQIDGVAAKAGLGVHQISLSGHRYASDIDLFGVLSAHTGRSMIGLDVKGATDGLTKLAWVKSADIKRKFPDELVVRIEERQPYAVWQLGEKYWLVDKSGLKLAPIMKPRVGELPRISGTGANKNFSDLMERLSGFDGIGSEISSFKYVGNRRWSLTFLDGVVVELPGDDVGRALLVLKELMGNRRVWTSNIKSIDLRLADRVSIIRAPRLGAARVASRPIHIPRINAKRDKAKSIEAKRIEVGHIETGTLSAADLALPTPDASLSSAPPAMTNRRGG